MAIPIRNTVRNTVSKPNYNMAYINTPAGATITGEIRKYATYQDMVTDASPARLASVTNASMDTNYNVPAEHVGGILYQRDNYNGTWILLYTASDLAVPIPVEWDNILNVPKWVGGVSCNRERLIKNTFAKPRTTYFSYGNYILILPDPNDVELGDQIVLEQYKGQGAICIPYTEGEKRDIHVVPIDPELSTSYYHVVYTHSDSEYVGWEYTLTQDATFLTNKRYYLRLGSGQPIIDPYTYELVYTVPGAALPVPNTIYYERNEINGAVDEANPITHNSFIYICTENEVGARIWRPLSGRNIEAALVKVRQELFTHLQTEDPHHQYLLKTKVRDYIKEVIGNPYILPTATEVELGGVYLARQMDVSSGVPGARAVCANILSEVLTTYATANHNHNFTELHDVDAATAETGQVPMYDASNHKWIPTTLSDSAVIYGDATVLSRGLVKLLDVSDYTSAENDNKVINGHVLKTILSDYRQTNTHDDLMLLSHVNIPIMEDGKYLVVSGSEVILTDLPHANILANGTIMIANTSDLVPDTSENAKAVTPLQLMTVSANLSSAIEDIIQSGGYILPAATSNDLGGTRLVDDTTLSNVWSSYSSPESAIVLSNYVVPSVNQFVSTVVAVSGTIMSVMTSNLNLLSSSVSGLNAVVSSAVNTTIPINMPPVGAIMEYSGSDILPTTNYPWHLLDGGSWEFSENINGTIVNSAYTFPLKPEAKFSVLSNLIDYVFNVTSSVTPSKYIQHIDSIAILPVDRVASNPTAVIVEYGPQVCSSVTTAHAFVVECSGKDGAIDYRRVKLPTSDSTVECVFRVNSRISSCVNTSTGASWVVRMSEDTRDEGDVVSCNLSALSGLSASCVGNSVVIQGALDQSVSSGAKGWVLGTSNCLICLEYKD